MGPLKRILTLLLFLIILFVLQGCTNRVEDREQVSPDQKLVIRFSHVVAENTPKGLAALRFAKLIQERTEGKVEVQVFPNSTLYADGEEMQALKEGAVQIIAPATSKLAGLFPSWQLLDLPYAFPNADAVHNAMEGPIGKRLTKNLDKNGFRVLAFWDSGFKQITNNVRPITNPEDLRGLKLRVMINSHVLQEQFRILGAIPLPTAFKDVYQTIEKNEVHGQENTISNVYSKKFYEIQPYVTITDHGYMGYVVIVNNHYWNGLPDDLRSVIEDTMAEVTLWERDMAFKLNELNLSQLRANDGVKIIELTDEEKKLWEEKLSQLYENKYIVNEIGAALVDDLLDLKKNSGGDHQ